jgi:hypothetical protein
MDIDLSELEAMPMPGTKAELLERMRPARAALEETIDSLSASRMVVPGHERWSVKDHLIHLAVWERMIVAHLRDGTDHEVVGLDKPTYEAMGLLDLNDRIHGLTRDLPLPDVMREFRGSHEAIVALLDHLSEEDLARPYWQDDAAGRTVIEKLAGDTYRHYLEHRRWIVELAGRPLAAGPPRETGEGPG